MDIKTKTTLRVADGLVKRRSAIFGNRQEQQSWHNEIRQLHNGAHRNHHLLGVMDLDYTYARKQINAAKPNIGYWYWRGVYEDKYGSIGSKALVGKDAKTLQTELNLAFDSQEVKDDLSFNRKVTSFFDRQFRAVNTGHFTNTEKIALLDRLGQQKNIMTNTQIYDKGPALTGRAIITNPFLTFFKALAQRYLVNSLISKPEAPYWVGLASVTQTNTQITYGGDFGDSCYNGAGIFSTPDVPQKRLQLYFVSENSASPCISSIFLIERLLMQTYSRGGARVKTPWERPDAICSYGKVMGVLAYCHLTWNETKYCFDL